MIIWITGRKNSGKTTLAHKIAKQIGGIVIDGDEVRKENKNDDFTEAGRMKNLLDITISALNANKAGVDVVIACVSPNRKIRKQFQSLLPDCIEIQMPFGELWPDTEYEE